MVSEDSLKLLQVFFQLSNIFGGTPYYWDPVQKKVYTTKIKIRKFHAQCVHLGMYGFWMLYTISEARKHQNMKLFSFATSFLLAILLDMAAMLSIATWRDRYGNLTTCIFRFSINYQCEISNSLISKAELNIN
jgi:hypothetical protein